MKQNFQSIKLHKLKDIISIDSKILGGVPRFKDTRIPIELLINYYHAGWSNEEIHNLLPDVDLDIITKTTSILSEG